MECTQQLDCSQDTCRETVKKSSDQIGYLGICGNKYPIKYGHNQIGRDPLCSIVLNMNSVSRRHAVINILNHKEFTLMDLESANKTKVMNENLKTLEPYIPYPIKDGDTVQFGDVLGVFKLLEDDSDLPATQVIDIPNTPLRTNQTSRSNYNAFKTTIPESPDVSDRDESFIIPSQTNKQLPLNNNSHFIKPSSKTISIQPVGSNKIDNIYWSSSKKSMSLNSSNYSLNTSNLDGIENKGDDKCDMQAQVFSSKKNDPGDPINSAETQISPTIFKTDTLDSPAINNDDIHELDTQVCFPQHREVAASIISENAYSSIHVLDTQINLPKIQKITTQQHMQLDLNLSDKENEDSIYNAKTQANDNKDPSLRESGFNEDSKLSNSNEKSKVVVNASDDDFTDCDDLDIFLDKNYDDLTDCEENDKSKSPKDSHKTTENIANMATQVLEPAFEDMLTQVLFEENPKQTEELPVSINQCSEEIISPFKIPTITKVPKNVSEPTEVTLKDDQYYKLTQDIYNDLCTQKHKSPEVIKSKDQNRDEEILLCSQENYVIGENFPHIEAQLLSPRNLGSSSSDSEKKVNAFVSGLSKKDINDMIGVQVATPKKVSSDTSDPDVTPKKSKPIRFSDLELPSSQDIKASISLPPRKTETSSESETECSEEQDTPVLFRMKSKPRKEIKKDLTKSLIVDELPSKILRSRKAITKLLESAHKETGVEKEIIEENILRLKKKSEKNKDTKNDTKVHKSKIINLYKQDKSKMDPNDEKKTNEVNANTSMTTDKVNQDKSKKDNKDNQKIKSTKTDVESNSEIANKSNNNNTRSSRTSRHKKKEKEPKPMSDILDKNKNRRSGRRKREPIKFSPSPEREVAVRRSKRQRAVKEIESVKETKSILKKIDQSTIYNVSSDINMDSSKSLKRSLEKDNEVPSSKRSRIVYPGSSSRSTLTRDVETQYVLFTAFPNLEVQSKLEKLGAKVVTDVKQCTVVVTLQIKRTFKLLCAVGLGKPIVGPNWVKACVDSNMVVDPWHYLIKDDVVEKRFKFSLERTLKGSRNFLKGYNISATPRVAMPANEMKLTVECSGGNWKEGGANWVCISCSADMALWSAIKERGASIVTSEFLLSGVLRQQLDIAGNLIK